MSIRFSKDVIYYAWANEKLIEHDGINYRVGRMSYGDYFLEPGKDAGERANFNRGTIWLEKQGNDYLAPAREVSK